jgi:hypothetical protein
LAIAVTNIQKRGLSYHDRLKRKNCPEDTLTCDGAHAFQLEFLPAFSYADSVDEYGYAAEWRCLHAYDTYI